MTFIKINETLYPATVSGRMYDKDWDNRESKSITMNGTFEEVNALLADGTAWAIVQEEIVPLYEVDEQGRGVAVLDEDGNPVTEAKQEEFDNSDYCIRGDLTVHTDGTCTVKMGKPTDLEDAYEIIYGGI